MGTKLQTQIPCHVDTPGPMWQCMHQNKIQMQNLHQRVGRTSI